MIAALSHLLRLARAGWVLAREGVFADLDPGLAPPEARAPLAFARMLARRGAANDQSRLPRAIARLGPSYVKLGQFLATRADVVGPEVVARLGELQDRMSPFPRDRAVATIEKALGKPLEEIFESFGEPVAAASIAQVHKARIRDADGRMRDVAVKVLRPNVERRFARDLSDMYFAARLAERHIPDAARLKPVGIVDGLARSVKIEMDFRLEAAAASEFAEKVEQDPDFHVPAIDWDRTAREVLTLEWVEGTPLSDIGALKRQGLDLKALGRTVMQSFLRHAVRDGLFHADMHQGNLLVDRDGRLTAVDFGIMGRLGPKEQRFLAEILYGFITRNYQRVAEVHFEAGYVPRSHRVEDFAQAIRAVGEPIHSRRADQISMAKLLTLLFEITGLFDMKTRLELVLLQKTMVVVEGVARTLDPQLDMWSTSEPIMREWIEDNLGPAGRLQDAGEQVAQLGRALSQAPQMLARADAIAVRLEAATQGGLALSEASIEAIGKAEARRNRWSAVALWIIAGLLALAILR